MAKNNIIYNMRYRYTQYADKKLTMKEAKLQTNTSDMFEYYDRDEACDKTISTSDAFDYYDYRIGSKGGFTKDGYRNAKECQSVIDKYKPQVIYQSVLSFDKNFAIDNNIIDKSNMEKLVKKSMPSILKEMGFNTDNVEWTGFYHTNTKYPHVHIAFYEKIPTRKMHRIAKNKLKKARSTIVSKMELNTQLYIQKDERLHDLLHTIDECCMSEFMKEKLSLSGNNCLNIPGDLKPIIKKMIALERVLPQSGSMKYNSKNIRPFHPQIQDIICDLYACESVKPFMNKYKELLDEIKETQIKLYGTGDNEYVNGEGQTVKGVGSGLKEQNKYYQDRLKELDTRIGNMILKNILDARRDLREQGLQKVSSSSYNASQSDSNDILDEFDDVGVESLYVFKTVQNKRYEAFPKVPMRKNLRVRTNNIQHAIVKELSNNIASAYYASLHEKQKINEVTRRAQQEIYALRH